MVVAGSPPSRKQLRPTTSEPLIKDQTSPLPPDFLKVRPSRIRTSPDFLSPSWTKPGSPPSRKQLCPTTSDQRQLCPTTSEPLIRDQTSPSVGSGGQPSVGLPAGLVDSIQESPADPPSTPFPPRQSSGPSGEWVYCHSGNKWCGSRGLDSPLGRLEAALLDRRSRRLRAEHADSTPTFNPKPATNQNTAARMVSLTTTKSVCRGARGPLQLTPRLTTYDLQLTTHLPSPNT